MSSVTAPYPPGPAQARRAPRGLRHFVAERTPREAMIVFLLAFLAYAALGWWTTLHLHVVYSDAQSRLAHAYLVWWNDPPKLAAVGFVWPPLQTLVFLPFAAIKPLATSLLALPLMSALFGGALISLLNRTLQMLGMRRVLRYPLVLAFALHPMVLDYASNGMAEIVNLYLLALGLHFFLRWYLGGGTAMLMVSGLALGVGFLTRYELAAWILVLAAALFGIHRARRASAERTEAALLMFLAPVVYAATVWTLVNVLIIGGSPLGWLTRAGGQEQGTPIHDPHPLDLVGQVVEVTARLSPLVIVATVALLVLGLSRRWRVALVLAACAGLNALTTLALVLVSPHTGLLQLRYNIRALPLALIAAAWLWRAVDTPGRRRAVWVVTFACLVASLPLAWDAMRHYPYQYEEQAFTRALATGRSQEGTQSIGGYAIGTASNRTMAKWINRHVTKPKDILADDATSLGVILASGRPRLFVTRIDKGDRAWLRVLARPYGRVRYFLVSDQPSDLISTHDFRAYDGKAPRGARIVLRTGKSTLLRIPARRPPAPQVTLTPVPSP